MGVKQLLEEFMNSDQITIIPFYLALFGLFFVFLSLRVIKLRRANKVALGDGDLPAIKRAIRAHGNFIEYVPLTALILLVLELRGTAGWWIHALALTLLLGRVLHAYSISQVEEQLKFRVSGMMLTFLTLNLSALTLLFGSLFG